MQTHEGDFVNLSHLGRLYADKDSSKLPHEHKFRIMGQLPAKMYTLSGIPLSDYVFDGRDAAEKAILRLLNGETV